MIGMIPYIVVAGVVIGFFATTTPMERNQIIQDIKNIQDVQFSIPRP